MSFRDLKSFYAEVERLQDEVNALRSSIPPRRRQFRLLPPLPPLPPEVVHDGLTVKTPAVAARPARPPIAGIVIVFGQGAPASVRTYDKSGHEIDELTGSYEKIRMDILKLIN